jgi:hypothetical protein
MSQVPLFLVVHVSGSLMHSSSQVQTEEKMHSYVCVSRFAKDGCTSVPSKGAPRTSAHGVGDQSR